MPSKPPSRQLFLGRTGSGNLSLVCELAVFRNFRTRYLYTFREDDIMILALKHDRRDPDYWRYRLDS